MNELAQNAYVCVDGTHVNVSAANSIATELVRNGVTRSREPRSFACPNQRVNSIARSNVLAARLNQYCIILYQTLNPMIDPHNVTTTRASAVRVPRTLDVYTHAHVGAIERAFGLCVSVFFFFVFCLIIYSLLGYLSSVSERWAHNNHFIHCCDT